jgi:hypothetical protein
MTENGTRPDPWRPDHEDAAICRRDGHDWSDDQCSQCGERRGKRRRDSFGGPRREADRGIACRRIVFDTYPGRQPSAPADRRVRDRREESDAAKFNATSEKYGWPERMSDQGVVS